MAVEPSILRQPSFAKFWCSQILSTASFQMLSVAIGWQMYDLTDSPFALGMVGLAQFVPMVLLTLLVGDAADRYDRRTIVCLCQVVEGCAAGVLAVGSSAGWLGRDGIYAVAAIVGACRAFENPTMAALVPMLVSRARFSKRRRGRHRRTRPRRSWGLRSAGSSMRWAQRRSMRPLPPAC
jgi:MFS family permease